MLNVGKYGKVLIGNDLSKSVRGGRFKDSFEDDHGF